MMIDSREASAALSDIEAITRRVRQSQIYRLSSLLMILWGGLVAGGNIITYLWPIYATMAWLGVYVVGIAASVTIGGMERARSGTHTFDLRVLTAYLLFFAFGFLWTIGLVQLPSRLIGVFWPTYFMLMYAMVGLWFGAAYVAIGLGISALTLIGYFFAGNWFDLWMAAVNGGGLVLGGLWMRRN